MEPLTMPKFEARTKGTTSNWPSFKTDEVLSTITGLRVLIETLPAITDSDIFPTHTRNIVERACGMLGEFAFACVTVEADRARRTQADNEQSAVERYKQSDAFAADVKERVNLQIAAGIAEVTRDRKPRKKGARRVRK